MLRISRTYVFYKRGVLQNVTKFTEKTRVAELIFKKVKLATAFKKTPAHVISCEFFEIIKDNFFIKHLRATASECWRPEKSSWLLVGYIIFQLFKFLILNDSILMDLLMVETLSSNLLLKSEGNH